MKCTNCDYENAPDANFCRKCGTALPKQPEKEDEKLCKKCGVQLPPEAIFCKKCGTPVEIVSTSETNQLNLQNVKNQPSLNQKNFTKQNREQIKKTKESPQGKATKRFHLKKPVILVVAIIVVLIIGIKTVRLWKSEQYISDGVPRYGLPGGVMNYTDEELKEHGYGDEIIYQLGNNGGYMYGFEDGEAGRDFDDTCDSKSDIYLEGYVDGYAEGYNEGAKTRK